MLSGLLQKPIIPLEVVPLVQFWRTGLEASRMHMTYAVETRMPTTRLCNVYYSQSGILEHLYKEVTVFDDRGWQAHTLFRRRHRLSQDEQSVVSSFRQSVLIRELRALHQRLNVYKIDEDSGKLAKHIRYEYRLFPALENVFQGLVNRQSLNASKREIKIVNHVDGKQQFTNPTMHADAKALFENILQDVVVQAERAATVEITMAGLTITFSYQGRDQRSLEKPYIQERADRLGWKINTSVSRGDAKRLTVTMNQTNFASSDIMARRKKTTRSLKALNTMSYADMISMAGLFVRAQPYTGYRLVGGKLDISRTPTHQVIESVSKLIEPIAHNMAQSIEGSRP